MLTLSMFIYIILSNSDTLTSYNIYFANVLIFMKLVLPIALVELKDL